MNRSATTTAAAAPSSKPSSKPSRLPVDATLEFTAVFSRSELAQPQRGGAGPGNENERKRLWALFALALAVRVGFVLLPPVWNRGFRWGDEWTYDEIATTLLGKGYFGYASGTLTLFRPPLYPALLAGLFGVFGHKFPPVYLFQALCGAVSAVLLALIGRRVTGSLAVGLVAGVIFVFTPLLVYITAVLYMETVYIALLLGVTLLWLKLIEPPLAKNWPVLASASGLLFGLSLLMRPTLFAFAPCLFVAAWAMLRRPLPAALITAVVTIATFALVLPWTYRNSLIPNGKGGTVLVSANGGVNLIQGNNNSPEGRSGGALDLGEYPALPELTEAERDKEYARRGIAWIKSHPAEFAQRIPLRVLRFFSPLETGNNGQVPTKLAVPLFVVYGAYYVLALVGLAQSLRRWRHWLLLHFLTLYSLALAALTYGNTRFGLIIQPFVMLLVAAALVALWQRLRARGGAATLTPEPAL